MDDSSTHPGSTVQDSHVYVPRQATEDALAALASYLRVGATRVVLSGPRGIGVSTLLRVVEARLANRLRIVPLAGVHPPAEELAGLILERLGEPACEEPERRLVSLARDLRERGSGLTILVDDAVSMSLPAIRRLSRLAGEARPALCLVLALGDDAEAQSRLSALDSPVESVSLQEAMTLEEARSLVEAKVATLSQAEREIFDDRAIEEIQRESAGIPGALVACLRARIDARTEQVPSRTELPAAPSAPGKEGSVEADLQDVTSEPLDAASMTRAPRRFRGAIAAFGAAAALLAILLLRGHGPSPAPGGGSSPPAQAATAAPAVASPAPTLPADETGVDREPEATPVPERSPEVEDPTTGETRETREPVAKAMPAAPPRRPARIRVAINAVPWARIAVDGRDTGLTPLGNVLLSPGVHRFQATLPDGRVVEKEEEISRFNRRVLFR